MFNAGRYASGVLLAVALSAALPPGQALAEPTPQDRAMYDSLFRDKIVAVQRSRDNEDDRILIGQMFEAAAAIPDSPGVQQLIYRGIYDLAEMAEDYASVLRAAAALREGFPDDPTVTDAKLGEMLERAYRTARGEQREQVGELYLSMLVGQARAAADADDTSAAADFYRQAQSVARTINSDRLEQIEAAVDRLAQRARLDARIQQLEGAVQANPGNALAARDLVAMLMLEKLDPARALPYVELTEDPDLIDVVRFAASGPDLATPPQALRVADWYYAHAQGADDAAAAARLSQALAYYNRMLEAYPRQDALRQRVGDLRDQAGDQLDQIRGEQADQRRGQWVDLIDAFDRNRHALGRDVAVRDGKLYSGQTDFILPVNPRGGYTLKLQLRYISGDNGISFCLPLADRSFSLNYSWWKHTRVHIPGTDRTSDRRFMLRPGREVELEVRVEPNPEQTHLLFLVDGEPVLDWTGPIRTPAVADGPATPEQFGNAIRVSCGGSIVFNAIQLIERSGD